MSPPHDRENWRQDIVTLWLPLLSGETLSIKSNTDLRQMWNAIPERQITELNCRFQEDTWNHASRDLSTAWICDVWWTWTAEKPQRAVCHFHRGSWILRFHTTDKTQTGRGTAELSLSNGSPRQLPSRYFPQCQRTAEGHYNPAIDIINSWDHCFHDKSDKNKTESLNVNTSPEQLHPFVFQMGTVWLD